MSTIQQTPPPVPASIATQYLATQIGTRSDAFVPQTQFREVESKPAYTPAILEYSDIHRSRLKSNVDLLKQKTTWKDREFREAYADAAVEQGIAWQVRVNREVRGWTQRDLAERVDTGQSAISRIEDPEYGSYSLPMLQKIAHAFDCALIVKFAAYSVLARESVSLSPKDLVAKGYNAEVAED